MSELIEMHNYCADMADSFNANGDERERANHMMWSILTRAYLSEIDVMVDELTTV